MRFLLRRPWVGLAAVLAVGLIGFLAWHARESGGTASVEKETAAPAGETRPLLRLSADDARRAGLVIKPLEATPAADAVELFGTVEVNKDKLARVVSPVAGRLAKINANPRGRPI